MSQFDDRLITIHGKNDDRFKKKFEFDNPVVDCSQVIVGCVWQQTYL